MFFSFIVLFKYRVYINSWLCGDSVVLNTSVVCI